MVHRVVLLDGDGGADALDVVHVGLVHALQELPRVGGEALHVPSVALGVDGVEGERGLARTARPGDDDEVLPRELEGDVLQVMFPRALDPDVFHQGDGGGRFDSGTHFLVTALRVMRATDEAITPQYDARGRGVSTGGGHWSRDRSRPVPTRPLDTPTPSNRLELSPAYREHAAG